MGNVVEALALSLVLLDECVDKHSAVYDELLFLKMKYERTMAERTVHSVKSLGSPREGQRVDRYAQLRHVQSSDGIK